MMIWQELSGKIGVIMLLMMHDDLAKTVEANRHDDYDDDGDDDDDDDCA